MTESNIDGHRLAIEWHPDAVRPPFDWSMQLPQAWVFLETHPSRWERQVERIVDDHFAGQRLSSKVRKDAIKALTTSVAAAQQNKILLTLVKVGVNPETKHVENVAMNVTWTSTTPHLASMAPIRKALSGTAAVEELTTPSGHLYALARREKREVVDGRTATVTSVQGFYPLAGTTWTLVVSVTTPQTGATEPMRNLVIRAIGSVSWDRDPGRQAGAVSATVADNDFPTTLRSVAGT